MAKARFSALMASSRRPTDPYNIARLLSTRPISGWTVAPRWRMLRRHPPLRVDNRSLSESPHVTTRTFAGHARRRATCHSGWEATRRALRSANRRHSHSDLGLMRAAWPPREKQVQTFTPGLLERGFEQDDASAPRQSVTRESIRFRAPATHAERCMIRRQTESAVENGEVVWLDAFRATRRITGKVDRGDRADGPGAVCPRAESCAGPFAIQDTNRRATRSGFPRCQSRLRTAANVAPVLARTPKWSRRAG